MSGPIVGKTVTYVETDLDVFRLTQFEAARAGEPIVGWSKEWDQNTTMVALVDAAMPSGRAARIARTVNDAQTFWKWTSAPDMVNTSAVALMRIAGAAQPAMALALRATGAAVNANAYALQLFDNALRITKIVVGAGSVLQSVAFPWTPGELVWMRFDALNIAGPKVLLRGKAWRGQLSDEPPTFTVSFEDSSAPFTGVGGAGVSLFFQADVLDVGHFRVRSLFGSALETWRFAVSTAYLPRSVDAVPNLTGVSLNPGAISLGEDLGLRSTLSVSFKDHKHADLGELFDRGSFWGKFRGRELFRRGQPVRVRTGLATQSLAEFETRHYVLDSFDGPSLQGAFSITAKDPLKLADNDRAQAPRLSNGFLNAAITNVATSASLSPVGIGNLEYPAAGIVAIGGEELCTFTRVGDTFTLTRGQFGTTPVAHSAEDRVQLCLSYTAQKPSAIIQDLFVNFASISPTYIPIVDWTAEVDTFLQRLYGRIIAEPTGVNRLVSELIEQAGLALWYDDKAAKLRLQVLRGIPTDATTYTESQVLQSSIRTQEQPGKRITEVWTYYGVRNSLEPLDQQDNYRSTLATTDLESATLNGSAVIRKIHGTWIPAFARTTAQRVNDLQIGRFTTPPRKINFDIMRHSGVPEPIPGQGYRFRWPANQDETGNLIATPIQILRVVPAADRFSVEAEEMFFKLFDPADNTNRVIAITSNINDVNVLALHNSQYPPVTPADVAAGVNLTVIINAGVLVGGTPLTIHSFIVGGATDWPVGFPITVRVNGRIQGRGGNGGGAGTPNNEGLPGLHALFTRFPFKLEIAPGGQIWSGGGGGGAVVLAGTAILGGGGGAGQSPGPGGISESENPPPTAHGQPGTTEAGGVGGTTGGNSGGAGGGPGLAGLRSSTGSGSGERNGGPPGAAVDGWSFVTVTVGGGDIRGPVVN